MGSINGFGKDLQWGVDDGVGLALWAIICGLCLRKPKRVFTFLKTYLVVSDYFERTPGKRIESIRKVITIVTKVHQASA